MTYRPLKARLLAAAGWSVGGNAFGQAVRFLASLALTRLLAPEMFGVVSLATVFIVGMALISDLGLKVNVIKSVRGDDNLFLDTVWTIQILRGIVLFFMGVALGFGLLASQRAGVLPSSSAYNDPALPYVISALSITAVINGFNSTNLYQAVRGLSLGKVTLIEMISQILGLAVIFLWIMVDRSVWALVAGSIFSALTTCFLSHLVFGGRGNRICFNRSAAFEIVSFGKWILLGSIVGFLAMSSDRVILAVLVDAHVLGIYTIAYNILNAGEQVLLRLASSALMPAFAEVHRKRPEELRLRFYQAYSVVATISYFLAGFVFISGTKVISCLYDFRYHEAGSMISILAISLLALPSQVAIGRMTATGRPQILAVAHFVRIAATTVFLPIGFATFGIYGAVYGIAIASLAPVPLVWGYSATHGMFDLRKELLFIPIVLLGILTGWVFHFATLNFCK